MDFDALVSGIVARERQAWEWLFRETARLARQAARRHRLDEADAGDLAQSVRLMLVEHVPLLREARCLRGWLVTTIGRHARRIRVCRMRELPIAAPDDYGTAPTTSPEAAALLGERDRALWLAAAGVSSAKGRDLVWLLAHRPELTQAELAAELDIAPGSIGPLRRRSLDAMRKRLLAEGFDISDVP